MNKLIQRLKDEAKCLKADRKTLLKQYGRNGYEEYLAETRGRLLQIKLTIAMIKELEEGK